MSRWPAFGRPGVVCGRPARQSFNEQLISEMRRRRGWDANSIAKHPRLASPAPEGPSDRDRPGAENAPPAHQPRAPQGPFHPALHGDTDPEPIDHIPAPAQAPETPAQARPAPPPTEPPQDGPAPKKTRRRKGPKKALVPAKHRTDRRIAARNRNGASSE